MDNIETLSDLLDADIASRGERRIVFQNLGNLILPIEQVGLKLGEQKSILIEEDTIKIQTASISVIQNDGAVISNLEGIAGECGVVEFNVKCRNLILRENFLICPISHIPLCLRHREYLRNDLIVNSTLPRRLILAAKLGIVHGENTQNLIPRALGPGRGIGPAGQPDH